MSDQDQETQDFGDVDGMGGIAIVGMAVRVPGASDLETYWRNLSQGVSSVSFFTDEELRESGVDPDLLRDPSYVRARGVPEAVDQFDAGLFGLTPREAETLDPQHRLFLELSWSAFDHAGYDPATYGGAVGVFAGSNISSYLIYNLVPHRELVRRIGPLQLRIRNDKDFLATQVSYKLNLKGPSVNVQTACSTSLVAVSLACQSLLGYQCDMALAGGVSVSTPPRSGYLYQEGVYASDGVCRAFDADAEGTVLGDGATVVLLKRMEDALADGDTIHAVIRGFATNNDGSLKLDYTAPSIDGQAEVIATAHAVGDVDPATIGYVEAHGTGTPLGDVIEVAALSQAFAAGTNQKGFCALGSVKTNIGHLDAAAGTASVIKAALALGHRQIPPSLHFRRPNPRLELEKTPFYVSTRLSEWKAPAGGTQPRRAGVSSFGVGGTNAHVVVEEAPEVEPAEPSARPWQPLVLSARSAEALEEATRRLADHLEAHPGQELADVANVADIADIAFTLQRGRKAFAHRRMLVARDREEAVRLLRGAEPRRVLSSEVHESRLPSVAFLFSGIGDQYVGMARGLYEEEPVFREQVDAACRILQPLLGLDLREVLFADAPERGKADLKRLLGRTEEEESPLDRTALLHPALFVVEYAMARLWISWGIRPEALIGYSLGEYVAACLAGVFPLEVALRLVAERARVIDSLPRGAMLAVPLAEADLTPLLGDRLSLAAVNGPAFCVAAGPAEEVAALEARLGERGVVCRRLRATHAFHSAMMEPARDAFLSAAAGVRLAAPSIPFVSNVTGTWITDEQATDPRYWAEHMTRTVRFGEGLEALCREADRVLVEVGPGSSLASIAVQLGMPAVAVPSIPHVHDADPDRAFLAGALGRLWLAGVRPDWAAYWGDERRRRVPLPAYPFERRRYWIDPPKPGEGTAASADAGADAIPARQADPADWFYAPVWKEAPRPASAAQEDARPWLVFLNAGNAGDIAGLGERLAQRLRERGRQVFTAEAGTRFEEVGDGRFRLAPGSPEDHEALLEAVRAKGSLPGTVVHLWSLGEVSGDLDRSQDAGFFSLLFLAQAWGHQAGREELRLVAVSSGACDVTGEEPLDPRRATLTGPCRVLPQENPAVACLHLDLPAALPGDPDRWAGQVLAEAEGDFREPVVALRGSGGSRRWVEDVQPTRLAGWDPATTRLRERGVYLITGGLGGIGLTLAVALAEKVKARLVLVGRTADASQPEVAERLRELEAKGGEVLVVAADVTRRDQMAEARRRAEERFGAVHGVIHAAGVPPGGLIQLKDRETAAAVLAPKLQGTLVLREVFAGAQLDFLVLCSSLTAVLGAFGLVDHCAANAFLDAYAQRAARDGVPVISVAWDSWLEVGQAARAGVSSRLRALLDSPGGSTGPKIHPLLDRTEGDGTLQSVFVTRLAARDQWILREHRVQGQGIVPATAFLEMARAAFAHVTGAAGQPDGRDVVLSEVVFSQPLLVADGGEREVRTLLRPAGEPWEGRYELRIVSSAPGEGHATLPQEHVRGWIERADPEPAAIAVADRVHGEDRSGDLAAALAASGVEFGPRWTGLLRELRSGDREGWARFELPEAFHADLSGFGLHPALLDAATGIARVLRDGAYLPFGLRRMRIRGPLPAAVQSRFRLPAEEMPAEELAADVTVFDAEGRPLVEIQGYTLRRIPDLAALRPAGRPHAAVPAKAEENDFGLTPAEGAEAFVRLLARGVEGPRVLVSTRDLGKLRERFRRRLTREQLEGHLELLRSAGPAHARPSLQTAYVAPRTETEEVLARLFREMLGIDRVGIHDNFFDLGGNSLVATQLLSRLRDELEVDVPLRALFEAPTVAELTRAVVARQAEMVDEEELAGALAELRGMSREELLARLASEADA